MAEADDDGLKDDSEGGDGGEALPQHAHGGTALRLTLERQRGHLTSSDGENLLKLQALSSL